MQIDADLWPGADLWPDKKRSKILSVKTNIYIP